MRSKKWVVSLLSVALAAILIFGLTMLFFDPLLQYVKEPGSLTYRTYAEIYSNPGIAKNYDYNAVLVGSSMVENTDVSEIDKLFGCTTIKVPYSGGSSYNHKYILDVCFRSDKQIDRVFWSLDEYALTTEKSTPRYPLPNYLYDDNKINDLSYLLNLDIFYFYTLKDVFGTLTHQQQRMMKDGSWAADESIYCKANALSSVPYPMQQQASKGSLYYNKNLTDNLNDNILPLVESHPETQFDFFMVPYSISYWYMQKQNGLLDAEIYDARTAAGELLKRDNVRLFFFQDVEEIITNLDNYKDYTHFKPEINSYMTKEMAKGSHLLTLENYNEKFDAFYDYLNTFHYDTFYQNAFEKND